MIKTQVSASQHAHPIFDELRPMPGCELSDHICGYFEVPGHVLCANVNSVRKHDKSLDLVKSVYAPEMLDTQRLRFEQGTF